jgi:RsiW-degrading membrane proteinase PrsW (M82 family)
MNSIQIVLLALATGILPAIFWMWFWLREDKLNPEPRTLIVLAFLGGVLAIIFSFILEKLTDQFILEASGSFLFIALITPVIEEGSKLFFAELLVLCRNENDEPIDPMIYMISVALGFAAIENAMFILDPFIKGNFTLGLMTGNLRFVGSTLLHILASATVGAFMGLRFYRSKLRRKVSTFVGLILAITLHGIFNFLHTQQYLESQVQPKVLSQPHQYPQYNLYPFDIILSHIGNYPY